MYIDRWVVWVVFTGDQNSVFDFAQSSLAEDIKLIQPNVFGHDHIKMSGGIAFWWQKSRCILRNGLLSNQNSSRVNP